MPDEWDRLFLAHNPNAVASTRPTAGKGAYRRAHPKRLMPTDTEFVRRELADGLLEAAKLAQHQMELCGWPVYAPTAMTWDCTKNAIAAYEKAVSEGEEAE